MFTKSAKLKVPSKFAADDILIFFFFLGENKVWH